MRAVVFLALLGCGGPQIRYIKTTEPCLSKDKKPPTLDIEPFVACNAGTDALACINDPEKFVRFERYLQDAAIWMRDAYTKCKGE